MNSQANPISLVLIDDHAALREALREALEREGRFRVVGEAGDASTALKVVKEQNPDVVVLDISLPDMSGDQIARMLTRHLPQVKIIAFSMYVAGSRITDIMKSGAMGYVSKTSTKKELIEGIEAVAAGRTFFCKEASSAIAHRLAEDSGVSHLSVREREVLRLIAQGKRAHAVADQLHISASTVEVHRRNIMRKLGLHNSVELARYAIREGIAPL